MAAADKKSTSSKSKHDQASSEPNANGVEKGKRRAVVSERYLTRREVAERLKTSERTIDRLIRTGQLPAIKIGPLVRVTERDLQVFVAERRI